MILTISFFVLSIGIILTAISRAINSDNMLLVGIIMIILSAVVGFTLLGTTVITKTTYEPVDGKIYLLENGAVALVLVGTEPKIYTDYYATSQISDTTKIFIATNRNSYGLPVNNYIVLKIGDTYK